jgi:hypothetical protein
MKNCLIFLESQTSAIFALLPEQCAQLLLQAAMLPATGQSRSRYTRPSRHKSFSEKKNIFGPPLESLRSDLKIMKFGRIKYRTYILALSFQFLFICKQVHRFFSRSLLFHTVQ